VTSLSEFFSNEPLLILVVIGILAAAAGWMIEHDRPGFSRALRNSGYLAMLASGLLLIGKLAHDASRSDAAMLLNAQPRLAVEGAETIVPMASDGHFWVEANVNGQPIDFLIDTGATYTGMGRAAALAAQIKPDPGEMPLELETANGTISARLGRAETVQFGNIRIRGLPIAVPDEIDDKTNVIGMNLLSQLGSWRVEGETLILTPATDQP